MDHTTSKNLKIVPAIFKNQRNIKAGQSTRLGGISPHPYASLNLGLHTDDDISNVRENRRRFFASFGLTELAVACSHQVHGTAARIVRQPGRYEGFDALVTTEPYIFLTVTVADCTPILLYDPVQRAVGAVHAGWKGTKGEIVRKTLQKMRAEFGTQAADCLAYIGPCIDECSFEVDADVADHFPSAFKRWDEEKKKFFVDLKKANKDQLVRAGLPNAQIEVSPYSTVLENEQFFSHRKENGQTGRMLCGIGLFP
ncbi:MAG: peptidoglycan editing factor PgeF [Bacteroidota bacterium]